MTKDETLYRRLSWVLRIYLVPFLLSTRHRARLKVGEEQPADSHSPNSLKTKSQICLRNVLKTPLVKASNIKHSKRVVSFLQSKWYQSG
jgi:hypothetical protein